MKILVLSRTPWREDNSFGNTYSNIFKKVNCELHSIYLSDGIPDFKNIKIKSFLQISESMMIKSIFSKKYKVGRLICSNDIIACEDKKSERKITEVIKKIKTKRFPLFFLMRELIWKAGKINWSLIYDYIKKVNPDILFVPAYYAIYVSRFALKIKKYFNIPMVIEGSIDIYSLKQINIDPLYWLNRFLIRNYIRKIAALSKKMYVISDMMKQDYEKYLKIKCDVLYKYPDESRKLFDYKSNSPMKFIYTGNLGGGRWKTMAVLSKQIYELFKIKVIVCTNSLITSKMKRKLSLCDIMRNVSSEEVVRLQNESDILIHVEPFCIIQALPIRYSISTKIMDYISCERCILAIGSKILYSIKYIQGNSLGIVCTNKKKIRSTIANISKNDIMNCINKIQEYKKNIEPFDFENSLCEVYGGRFNENSSN